MSTRANFHSTARLRRVFTSLMHMYVFLICKSTCFLKNFYPIVLILLSLDNDELTQSQIKFTFISFLRVRQTGKLYVVVTFMFPFQFQFTLNSPQRLSDFFCTNHWHLFVHDQNNWIQFNKHEHLASRTITLFVLR